MLKKVSTKIEVRYQETDQMGVVYHANYLVWFEIGRTKYIEHLGFNYADMEKEGIVSPVLDVQITYKYPVRYGENAKVNTWLKSYDGIRTVYAYEVLREDDQIAVEGETSHVIVNKETFKPTTLRKAFPTWHKAYKNALEEE